MTSVRILLDDLPAITLDVCLEGLHQQLLLGGHTKTTSFQIWKLAKFRSQLDTHAKKVEALFLASGATEIIVSPVLTFEYDCLLYKQNLSQLPFSVAKTLLVDAFRKDSEFNNIHEWLHKCYGLRLHQQNNEVKKAKHLRYCKAVAKVYNVEMSKTFCFYIEKLAPKK